MFRKVSQLFNGYQRVMNGLVMCLWLGIWCAALSVTVMTTHHGLCLYYHCYSCNARFKNDDEQAGNKTEKLLRFSATTACPDHQEEKEEAAHTKQSFEGQQQEEEEEEDCSPAECCDSFFVSSSSSELSSRLLLVCCDGGDGGGEGDVEATTAVPLQLPPSLPSSSSLSSSYSGGCAAELEEEAEERTQNNHNSRDCGGEVEEISPRSSAADSVGPYSSSASGSSVSDTTTTTTDCLKQQQHYDEVIEEEAERKEEEEEEEYGAGDCVVGHDGTLLMHSFITTTTTTTEPSTAAHYPETATADAAAASPLQEDSSSSRNNSYFRSSSSQSLALGPDSPASDFPTCSEFYYSPKFQPVQGCTLCDYHPYFKIATTQVNGNESMQRTFVSRFIEWQTNGKYCIRDCPGTLRHKLIRKYVKHSYGSKYTYGCLVGWTIRLKELQRIVVDGHVKHGHTFVEHDEFQWGILEKLNPRMLRDTGYPPNAFPHHPNAARRDAAKHHFPPTQEE
eukprot:TRINITY_DN66954_c7_g2_i2.p1 TRINITY_DN66954_c7_g2~~TRINITY_DN66954_c7_g2_i2.p1  ORF type:complete len:506 (+),score=97.64 TRINITY_DN66954_c7_g2_i2:52-1569(+)